MASSQHVEMEAAKLLHKLIQESKDEPAKLATKLYVVCSSTDNSIEGHEKSENLYQLASYFMFDVPDMSAYETKWKGAVTAISSHIEVCIYFFTIFRNEKMTQKLVCVLQFLHTEFSKWTGTELLFGFFDLIAILFLCWNCKKEEWR
jgi:hypothetical protein